jgi:hypothetical protein
VPRSPTVAMKLREGITSCGVALVENFTGISAGVEIMELSGNRPDHQARSL